VILLVQILHAGLSALQVQWVLVIHLVQVDLDFHLLLFHLLGRSVLMVLLDLLDQVDQFLPVYLRNQGYHFLLVLHVVQPPLLVLVNRMDPINQKDLEVLIHLFDQMGLLLLCYLDYLLDLLDPFHLYHLVLHEVLEVQLSQVDLKVHLDQEVLRDQLIQIHLFHQMSLLYLEILLLLLCPVNLLDQVDLVHLFHLEDQLIPQDQLDQ